MKERDKASYFTKIFNVCFLFWVWATGLILVIFLISRDPTYAVVSRNIFAVYFLVAWVSYAVIAYIYYQWFEGAARLFFFGIFAPLALPVLLLIAVKKFRMKFIDAGGYLKSINIHIGEIDAEIAAANEQLAEAKRKYALEASKTEKEIARIDTELAKINARFSNISFIEYIKNQTRPEKPPQKIPKPQLWESSFPIDHNYPEKPSQKIPKPQPQVPFQKTSASTITCPNCQKQRPLKPEWVGRRVQCSCGHTFVCTSGG